MKIIFFIGALNRGGAERVISILANHYAEKGWEVGIILLLKNTVKYHLNDKIKIIDFSRQGSYIKNLFYWIINIRNYVKKEKPDKIVSFIGRINYLVLTSLIGINIPIIVSERNDPKNDGRGILLKLYGNLCYRLAKSIVFQTNYQKLCFSKKLYKKSFVIANPVDVNCLPVNSHANKLEIVTAGRLEAQKNQELLINAFHILNEKYSSLSLKIYGEGSLRKKLQTLIDTYNLADKISLCGNVSDLHKKISESTIFVLTSEYEGLSNALIEAMMLGIPCVTTDYPGADEIIKHNYNGIIVPRNDVVALSNAIVSILDDKSVQEKFSKNSINIAKNYKKENILKEWETVIEKY